MLQGQQQKAFDKGVEDHGQQTPIMLFEGQVLDGRNRLHACDVLGITPKTKEFKGTLDAAAKFVLSMNNDARRHSGEGDRTLAASKVAIYLRDEKERRGGDQQKRTPCANAGKSAEIAAQGADVSTRKVEQAMRVRDQAIPEVEAAMDAADVSVRDAAVASEPPKVQKQALKDVKKGKAKTLAEAVKKRKGKKQGEADPTRDLAEASKHVRGAILAYDLANTKKPDQDRHGRITHLLKEVLEAAQEW
jgi:hypothetical protein